MSGERVHTFRWEDPALIAARADGLTGYEFLRGILEGTIPQAPILFALGVALSVVEKGRVCFRGTPREFMYNPMNGVHGGIACLVLDSAMGSAVMTTLDDRTAYTTIDLSVHLTRPITVRTGPFTAEGKVVTRGTRIATAEGRLVDEQDRLLAHATTTCLLLERS